MSTIDPDDQLLGAVGGLPTVRPDAAHVERVRRRCHAGLRQPARPVAVSLEPAAITTMCALYAWHIARIASRISLP